MSVVDPADIRAAAAKVDEACRHFEAQRKSLELVEIDREFVGGHGETGGYQSGLQRFTKAFNDELKLALDDEQKFVNFLVGFRDRINQAAGMHEATELRNTETLNKISGKFDEGGL